MKYLKYHLDKEYVLNRKDRYAKGHLFNLNLNSDDEADYDVKRI